MRLKGVGMKSLPFKNREIGGRTLISQHITYKIQILIYCRGAPAGARARDQQRRSRSGCTFSFGTVEAERRACAVRLTPRFLPGMS